MKKFENVCAQGDILIRRIPTLPTGLKPVEATDGRIVVTHSETGHDHITAEMQEILNPGPQRDPQIVIGDRPHHRIGRSLIAAGMAGSLAQTAPRSADVLSPPSQWIADCGCHDARSCLASVHDPGDGGTARSGQALRSPTKTA